MGVKIKTVAFYCANCGHKVIGVQNEGGKIHIVCDRCKAFMISSYRNKTVNIKITPTQN